MKWFINLTTRAKLLLSFGLMTVFLLIVIASAHQGFSILHQSQEELFQNDFLPAVQLVELRSTQNRARTQLLEMMMTTDKVKHQELEKDIRERSRDIDEGLKVVSESLKSHPLDLQKISEMAALLVEYRRVRDTQIALIHAGKSGEAAGLEASEQIERYNRIRGIARELGNAAITEAKTRIAEANARAELLSKIFIAIGVLVFTCSVAAAFFLSHLIAKPLQELTAAAKRISAGDLGVTIEEKDRQDEVGHLTMAFTAMVRYLQDMAAISRQIAQGNLAVTVQPATDKDILGIAFVDMTGYLKNIAALSQRVSEGDLTATVQPVSGKDILGIAFANMLGNLRKINEEIGDGVNVLASSAGEILASTNQIASAMAETATSVAETTATVEQSKQTALLSSKKARSVSENAQKAVQVAEQGYANVSETLTGINHIKQLMETVAESVVLLSEQTQAIGEITAVVTDLAQQSNLLAVNAAIEASKAGEHGKGFSVVAVEIKSLADQSKQATEQVRKILGDIQKATVKSVLAAEQVSKAVEGGVKQSAESGESIHKLAENIGQAAQAAEQIAVSSQQQLAGMEQVAIAMENIKQATHQNVLGTKQVENAAHTLNEFGQKLKEMVSRFKV
ncbi:MAG: methyl-accepting chemotaxis protein [Desulforhopalus sp.]|nr:methyl-accepting chemotaxis protein [Desulforhopalus sp.]